MVVRARHEIVNHKVLRARRALAEPTGMLARHEFVKPKVRAWFVLAMCYSHIALGVCLPSLWPWCVDAESSESFTSLV